MYSIAIVEDDKKTLETYKSYVLKYFEEKADSADKDSSFTVDCFANGISFLSSPFKDYDIVIMNINLPMKDGISTAKDFRKINSRAYLIFISSKVEMAIRGYEVAANDFIVKPLDFSTFKTRFDKGINKIFLSLQDCVSVISNRSQLRIPIQSIVYVEIVGHRLIYHTRFGDIEVWGTMAEAEKSLERYNFVRCNSGFLINLRYVTELRLNEVHVGGYKLLVSRNRHAHLKASLLAYFSPSKN